MSLCHQVVFSVYKCMAFYRRRGARSPVPGSAEGFMDGLYAGHSTADGLHTSQLNEIEDAVIVEQAARVVQKAWRRRTARRMR